MNSDGMTVDDAIFGFSSCKKQNIKNREKCVTFCHSVIFLIVTITKMRESPRGRSVSEGRTSNKTQILYHDVYGQEARR